MVSESADIIESLIKTGLDRVVEEKTGLVSFTFSDSRIMGNLYHDATKGIVRALSRPHGRDTGWVNMKRTTFFPDTDRREPTLLRRVASSVLASEIWVPRINSFSKQVEDAVRQSGQNHGIDAWSGWNVNRIGVNFAYGSDDLPAKIGEHTDVEEEQGLVVAVEIHEGEIPGRRYTPPLNVSLIIGADVCASLDMAQALHGGEAINQTRLSMTLANLCMA